MVHELEHLVQLLKLHQLKPAATSRMHSNEQANRKYF